MKTKLLILCMLLSSIQVVAQEANQKEQELRRATAEELEYLVPEVMEEVKKTPKRVIITQRDDQMMETLSSMKMQGQATKQDIIHFLQLKVNQGADKDAVISFANMLNSTYMSMLSKEIQLDEKSAQKIEIEKTKLQGLKAELSTNLQKKIKAEQKRLMPNLSEEGLKLFSEIQSIANQVKMLDPKAETYQASLNKLKVQYDEKVGMFNQDFQKNFDENLTKENVNNLITFEENETKKVEKELLTATKASELKSKEILENSLAYQNILNQGRDFQKELEVIVEGLDYELKGTDPVDYEIVQKLNVGLLVPKDFKIGDANDLILNAACGANPVDLPVAGIKQNNDELVNIAENVRRKGKGRLYFFWGYNRAFHSKSDVTFKTSEGEFTIKDAHGDDRPSTIEKWEDLLTYVRPADFTIPQFNFRIGYMFNDTWGIEGGTDHMKWIFDNKRQYEITGEFSPTVYVENPNAQHGWDGVMPVDFDYVKEHGDATWLGFEHSDGYNYVHLSAVFNKNLYTGKKGKFAINAGGTVGGGAMIPKTKVMMHRDQAWNWTGLDNRFHVAGYGGHAELSLSFKFFDRFALKGSVRGTAIKIDNALVYTDRDPNARLSHTPIYSLQYNVGLEIDLWKRKK